uniref:Uncharacterized protein n=1 Tax=Palpitomonas bilix TaxID=652834 RepID=A0A7S3GGL7_9EUKA|mmetsp:Transcript_48565/g.126028  ORF Transcript_48565/g.126028 Transcript_48565/m.126028 type:complete len:133 (+) Transcript_48565:153-551(+)
MMGDLGWRAPMRNEDFALDRHKEELKTSVLKMGEVMTKNMWKGQQGLPPSGLNSGMPAPNDYRMAPYAPGSISPPPKGDFRMGGASPPPLRPLGSEKLLGNAEQNDGGFRHHNRLAMAGKTALGGMKPGPRL